MSNFQDPFAPFLADGKPNLNWIDPADFLQVYQSYVQIQLVESRADVFLAHTRKVAQLQCDLFNANLASAYAAQFSFWLTGWLAGTVVDKATVPVPPASFVVIEVPTSESPGAPSMGVADQSGPPVVPMPPIPDEGGGGGPAPPPPAFVIKVGVALGGGYFAVLPGDTFPVGQTTPLVTSAGPSGVTGRFLRFGSPFGPLIGGSYLLVGGAA